jgi:hypothetical protein
MRSAFKGLLPSRGWDITHSKQYIYFWYHGHRGGSLEMIWKRSVSKRDTSYKIPGWKIFTIRIETYTVFNVGLLAPLSKALVRLSDIWYVVNCKVNSTTKDPTAWLAWWLTCGITALRALYIICKKENASCLQS